MTCPAAAPPAPGSSPSGGPTPRILVCGLVTGGFLCLTLITLVHPGATRMYAWPWSLAYFGTVILPSLALLLRAFDPQRPIALPDHGWLGLAVGAALVTLASALASPYRGPALLWSASLLGGVVAFVLTVDWLNSETAHMAARRERVRDAMLILFALIAAVSVCLWLRLVALIGLGPALAGRNPYPLGHANYTAGLAMLILPTSAAMAFRHRGRWQMAAITSAGLSLVLLFTSGSRGGLLGLAALVATALFAAPVSRGRKMLFTVVGITAAVVFALAQPRTRAMLAADDPGAAPNISNVQREAMLLAGWRMGTDRPWFGWGPGTTPLAFPRYRAGLDGGAENVLQLHSLPVQIWAELGGAGIVCLLAFVALAARAASQDFVAASTLAGYGVFALTDWQLDVPIFAGAIAVLAAQLAPPAPPPLRLSAPPKFRLSARHAIGGLIVVCLAAFALLARNDPAPELNARALMAARDPAGAERAVALFEQSLALNPDQEIAHFNLGWLQVVSHPEAAETHFLAAAHLVPDKGGVYFGLGLARLNQGRGEDASRAFALEALNDPSFLTSPWWSEPAIAALRDATAAEYSRLLKAAAPELPAGTWAAAQLTKLAQRTDQLGRVPPGPGRTYRRERTGYPVLMRDLDLPTPTDLFDVREATAATGSPGEILPPKGWLPSPLLLSLLDRPHAKSDEISAKK